VEFVVDKVASGQVFSLYFGFLCQNRSFHQHRKKPQTTSSGNAKFHKKKKEREREREEESYQMIVKKMEHASPESVHDSDQHGPK
jgi:hypothetical protein